MSHFHAPKEAVMPSLLSTERRLGKDPERPMAYKAEIKKLINAGSVLKLQPSELTQEGESWYIPPHMVSHNGKK